MNQRYIILIIGGACFVVFGCVFLGLFFGGYMIQNEWNNNSEYIRCQIINNEARPDTCYRECNCRRVCTGSGDNKRCHRRCDTCPYTCYNGYTLYNFILDNQTYTGSQLFFEKVDNSLMIYNTLNSKYPPGSESICYYQPNNPSDNRLELYDAVGFLVGPIIVGVIGLLIFTGAGVYVLYDIIKR